MKVAKRGHITTKVGFKRIIWAAVCRGLRRQGGDRDSARRLVQRACLLLSPFAQKQNTVQSSHQMLIFSPRALPCLRPLSPRFPPATLTGPALHFGRPVYTLGNTSPWCTFGQSHVPVPLTLIRIPIFKNSGKEHRWLARQGAPVEAAD